MDSYLFDLTPQLLHDAVLSMIAVLTLFCVASYLLFNPVREMMAKRRQKIKDELDEAKENQETAEKLRAEYEAKLRDIDKEAEEILSAARQKALANEAKIIADAKEEAVRIRQRAETEAELEKKKAADDVKREMVSIASLMAGKIVAASMNVSVQEGLLEETLKEIGDTTWLS